MLYVRGERREQDELRLFRPLVWIYWGCVRDVEIQLNRIDSLCAAAK